MPPERCPDCPRDATHTLFWSTTSQQWQITALRGAVHRRRTIHRYCRWHATCRTVQRNAAGVRPGLEELRRLLARQETEAARCSSRGPAPPSYRCGDWAGHTGAHTALIPTGAPWFPRHAAAQEVGDGDAPAGEK